jgi:ATP/maltotriose-dependent transcriptional regulator MalT
LASASRAVAKPSAKPSWCGKCLVATEAPEPFAPNTASQQTLGITARELEILTLIARGLSNREIATQLFVSENTVKTHCARAFDKLGAARRTQAVQRGKELGLLP